MLENINIPKDKEDEIYKAALDEFAAHGYLKGSTNEIVKNISISKGSLFKYFGNKQTLYIYVVLKALETLEVDLLGNIDDLTSDLFERISQIGLIKLKMSLKYPRETSIVMDAILNIKDEKIMNVVKERMDYYVQMTNDIFMKDIDYSKFKEGVDIAKVVEILMHINQGLLNKPDFVEKYGTYEKAINNYDAILEEVYSYTDIIKESVYKVKHY